MPTFYCNYFFAWNSGAPYTREPPGLCLPCLPHCYATGVWAPKNARRLLCNGRSRSSKVIDFGANGKCVHAILNILLLVINGNLGRILPHFRDTADSMLLTAIHSYMIYSTLTLAFRSANAKSRLINNNNNNNNSLIPSLILISADRC